MKVQYEIEDITADGKQLVEIEATRWGLTIRPVGYGDNCSGDGSGSPVYLEVSEGIPRLIVYADINQEDPTHTIDLSGAKETNRKKGFEPISITQYWSEGKGAELTQTGEKTYSVTYAHRPIVTEASFEEAAKEFGRTVEYMIRTKRRNERTTTE